MRFLIEIADSLHNVKKCVEERVVMQCNQRIGRNDPRYTQRAPDHSVKSEFGGLGHFPYPKGQSATGGELAGVGGS